MIGEIPRPGDPAAAAEPARPAVRPPEPGRFWIRFMPRGWPPPEAPWTDLAAGGLGAAPTRRRGGGGPGGPATLPLLPDAPLDDVLYLPPVPAALETERRALTRRRLAAGTPVVVQMALGGEPLDSARRLAEAGATLIYDPLPALLAGGLERLRRVLAGGAGAGSPVAPGAAAVWPLVPGLADEADAPGRACELLAAAGLSAVQPLQLQLAPADRRRLAELGGPAAFHALFHRPAPEGRALARAAVACGLSPFVPRPLPPVPPAADAVRGNRRLSGLLALAGELWLRLGRPEAQGQAYFRAARWVDATAYDVGALAREGNLAVVAAVDEGSRSLIAAALRRDEARAGTPSLPAPIAELLAEYVALGGGGAEEER